MKNTYPLRVHAGATRAIWQMPIPIITKNGFIGWPSPPDRTPTASRADLQSAIERSVGQNIPNDYLASFGPGDVVLATDGLFWITPEWKVEPLAEDDRKKAKQVMAAW